MTLRGSEGSQRGTKLSQKSQCPFGAILFCSHQSTTRSAGGLRAIAGLFAAYRSLPCSGSVESQSRGTTASLKTRLKYSSYAVFFSGSAKSLSLKMLHPKRKSWLSCRTLISRFFSGLPSASLRNSVPQPIRFRLISSSTRSQVPAFGWSKKRISALILSCAVSSIE